MVACERAEMPPGLLGHIDPSIWNRLAIRFGKGPAEWGLEDWQKAARILGLMIDQIEESERNRKFAESLPKRRGPKPRLSQAWQGMGLLDFPVPKKGGRPRTWTEEDLRNLYALAEHTRHTLRQEGQSTTDKAVSDRILHEGWKRARHSNPTLRKGAFESSNRGRLRNALIRAKKLCSQ